jgi:hypothetical protein
MIHQFDEKMAPDSAFESGAMRHLVAGNVGRLLDPRRTPVRIDRLRPEIGAFIVEITAFEDRGARWTLPFEDVSDFQFALGSACASAGEVAAFEETARRLDQPLEIACDGATREQTEARLAKARARAVKWLEERSTFLFEGARSLPLASREGDRRLWLDTRAYMNALELRDVEDAFAGGYVSNPRSNEMVKGHAIVLAELALVPYRGTVVRDPEVFSGAWSRARRADHVVARLAWVHAVYERTGNAEVTLFRGMALDGDLEVRHGRSLVSATFSEEVAHAMFDPAGTTRSGVLWRQRTPAKRLFMTYAETSQMNQAFKEAEAVLLGGDVGVWF